jgi:hypothetical protein
MCVGVCMLCVYITHTQVLDKRAKAIFEIYLNLKIGSTVSVRLE